MSSKYVITPYQKYIDSVIIVLILFSVWNFKWEENLSFVLCQIIWTAYLLFIFLLLKSKQLKYFFEPPIYFLLFAILYELPKFPYIFKLIKIRQFLTDNYLGNPVHKVNDYYASSCLMYVYQFFCISFLFIIYNVFKKKNEIKQNIRFSIRRPFLIIYFILLLIVIGAISLYVNTRGNIFLYLARRSGNLEDTAYLDDVSYLYTLSTNLPLILIPIAVSLFIEMNRKWNKIIWLLLPCITLSYLMSGVRGNAIYSILSVIIVLFSLKQIQFSLLKASFLVVTLVLAFGFFGTLRRSFSDTNTIELTSKIKENKEWYYELSGYQLQLRDEMVMEYADKVGHLHGSSYMNIIFFPIPKSIVGDLKPVFLDRTVAIQFWKMDWTALPLNAMMESYYNFGYGGIMVFFILGFLMANWTNYLVLHPSTLFISFSIVVLIFLQAWSSTYIVYSSQYAIITIVLFKIMKISKRKSITPVSNTTPVYGSIAY
jgi:oligosaccharide repeat unit polymerase